MVRWPAAVLALVLALGGEAWSGQPTETLNEVVAAVNQLVDDPAFQEKPAELLAAIRAVIADSFDAREASRLVLGREWEVRTATEREEFVRLFKELVENAYLARIASRATMRSGLSVHYQGEVVDGERATVTTTVEGRDGGAIPLEHRMIRHGQRWMVYDISIDGVGLAANYRVQFQRVLRRSSYPALAAELKARASSSLTAATVAAEASVVATPSRPAARAETSPAPGLERDAAVAPESPLNGVALRAVPEALPSAPSTGPPALLSFWISMGALTSQAAGELVSRLLEASLPLAIDAMPALRGQLLLRVRIGPFTNRAEAAAKLHDLQALGYQSVIAHERD